AGGHGSAAWSPDEKRLVFAASDRRTSALWSVALDGSELVRIGGRHVSVFDPVFSPDGRQVYYSAVSESGHYGLWSAPVGADGRAAGEPARIADLGLGVGRYLA